MSIRRNSVGRQSGNPGVKHRICSRRSNFGSLRTAYIGVPSRSRTPHSMSLLPTAALHFFDRWLKFERAYCHSWAFHGGRQRQLHECGRERKQWRRHFPVAKRHGHRPLHCKHESVWWRNAHQEGLQDRNLFVHFLPGFADTGRLSQRIYNEQEISCCAHPAAAWPLTMMARRPTRAAPMRKRVPPVPSSSRCTLPIRTPCCLRVRIPIASRLEP